MNMKREIQIIVKEKEECESSLTITPIKTTLKLSQNLGEEKRNKIIKLVEKIHNEHTPTQSWSGKFDKNGVKLWNDTKTKTATFKFEKEYGPSTCWRCGEILSIHGPIGRCPCCGLVENE